MEAILSVLKHDIKTADLIIREALLRKLVRLLVRKIN